MLQRSTGESSRSLGLLDWKRVRQENLLREDEGHLRGGRRGRHRHRVLQDGVLGLFLKNLPHSQVSSQRFCNYSPWLNHHNLHLHHTLVLIIFLQYKYSVYFKGKLSISGPNFKAYNLSCTNFGESNFDSQKIWWVYVSLLYSWYGVNFLKLNWLFLKAAVTLRLTLRWRNFICPSFVKYRSTVTLQDWIKVNFPSQ